MLSFEQIKQDLDDSQKRLDYLLKECTDSKDCLECNSNETVELSEKMTKIVVWFMQNGYVMP